MRVSGGAYGGFSDFDPHSGQFTYLSYRDPNLLKTLDNYDGTPQFLRELELDQARPPAPSRGPLRTAADCHADCCSFSFPVKW